MSTVTRPKPRRERVRLELIVPECRFQMRAYPDGATFDEDYVTHLLDLLAGGAELDPMELVEEDRGKGREPLRHLIDGMNRHEAYRRAGVGTAECLIYSGTARDAELWALASNSKHGRARTPDDCRKAFDKLLGSVSLLERVVADRGKFQGTERALAAACGLSHGAVGKYLKERNLRVDRLTGKLIPADGSTSPERDARRELVQECRDKGLSHRQTAAELGLPLTTVQHYSRANAGSEPPATKPATPAKTGRQDLARAGEDSEPARILARAGEIPSPSPSPAPTPEPVKPPTPASEASPVPEPKPKPTQTPKALPSGTDVTVDEALKLLAKLAGKFEALVGTPAMAKLKRHAQANGAPVVVKEEHVRPDMPRPGDPLVKRTTHWPALEALQATFAAVANELALGEFDFGKD